MPTHHRGSESEVRALNAYINLVRASDSVVSRLSAQIEATGLTLPQFGILEAVYHLGPLCQKTLAEKLLRSSGNITVVVANLEKHGWVRGVREAEDRRMIQIHLTPRGRKLIARVFPKHAKEIAKQFGVLSVVEQETLRGLCRKLGTAGKCGDESAQRRHQKGETK